MHGVMIVLVLVNFDRCNVISQRTHLIGSRGPPQLLTHSPQRLSFYFRYLGLLLYVLLNLDFYRSCSTCNFKICARITLGANKDQGHLYLIRRQLVHTFFYISYRLNSQIFCKCWPFLRCSAVRISL